MNTVADEILEAFAKRGPWHVNDTASAWVLLTVEDLVALEAGLRAADTREMARRKICETLKVNWPTDRRADRALSLLKSKGFIIYDRDEKRWVVQG